MLGAALQPVLATCIIQLNVPFPHPPTSSSPAGLHGSCPTYSRGAACKLPALGFEPGLPDSESPDTIPAPMSNQFIKTLLAPHPPHCPATETSAAPFPGEQIPSWLERSRDNVGRQFKQLQQNTPAVFTPRHYYTFQPRRDWPISGISSLLQLFPTCNWFCGTQREGGWGWRR